MLQQLHLQGIEQPDFASLDQPTFVRHAPSGTFNDLPSAFPTDGMVPAAQATGTVPVVSLFTLGRFSLLLHGKAPVFGRKTPQRPLELLKAIVAYGGRDVSTTSLLAALWPDADGDVARRSLDTTLHRLRKIVGDDKFISLSDGKVSLDSRHCWVDVWSFERLLGQTLRAQRNDLKGTQVSGIMLMTENLINLYQGHFLGRDNVTFWTVSMQEKLRSKFIHHLLETGRYMETHGRWGQAMFCYNKGIDVDDLLEVFYQRMMVCCLKTGRISEGMSFYRRCQQTLSIKLGLQPEQETESAYRALREARL